jgi:hypothetical protein
VTCPTTDPELRAVLACIRAAFGQVEVVCVGDPVEEDTAWTRQPLIGTAGEDWEHGR